MDIRHPPPLYEIRWQGLNITELAPDGVQSFATISVRMYHSEPPSAPSHFVGHHVHEKRIDVDDINATQQIEIKKAVKLHDQGRAIAWGIA